MKAQVLALTLVLTASFAAQAKPVNKDKVARTAALEYVNLDPSMNHPGKATGGNVEVDVPHKKAYLNVMFAMYCPEGQLCAQMMPAPLEIALPIVSVKYDFCGTKIIVAKRDSRPVDGDLQMLTIEDNTQNRCPHVVAMAGTTVIYQTSFYDRRGGGEVKTTSNFYAAEMLPMAF